MTREELADKIRRLSAEAMAVDTDASAVLSVVARMLLAGDNTRALTPAVLEAERKELERRAQARR